MARATGVSRCTVQKYPQAALGAGIREGRACPTEAQLLALVPLNRVGPKQAAVPNEGGTGWPGRPHNEAWVR